MFGNLFPIMFVCSYIIGCGHELTFLEFARICDSLIWYYLYFVKVEFNCTVIEFMDKEVRLCTRKRFNIKENYLLYWGI